MATPYYDEDTEGMVYLVQPEEDDCDDEDWDMQSTSTYSTARTTSTITSDQLGDFFREAHGRTFPLDENLPLTYPVDDVEALRHQMQHQFLKALVHGNYVGPVREVLKPRIDGSRPRILDIRTCDGSWAQEMAVEFPHCDIVSVDIAPIVNHAPRANVKFEVYDLYAGVAEPDESFDYISCRHVQLHVKEYDRLIFDLHRVLRPGGLVTICEVENYLFEADQPPYDSVAYRTLPVLSKGLDIIRAAIQKQGVDLSAVYQISDWLQPNSPFWTQTGLKYQIQPAHVRTASQGFRHIRKQIVLLPTGTWHPDPAVKQVGALITRVWTLAWRQLEPALVEYGLTQGEANEICRQAMDELAHTELQCLGKYHMVTATKGANTHHKWP
ncbi:methyltransferase domain protein [Rhizoctonia solani 123E]|uniref:Methyltransferase domain protein n=1 Tax=Rhizoctonia solani 123E TaxID=1423351 RepID=A0A074SBP7_9AGAM|nr:methyltransferase domain protein [Rhizoctonia solani 123E]